MKFEAHAGREFLPKRVEPVKKIKDGGFKLVLGTEEGRVDRTYAVNKYLVIIKALSKKKKLL